MARKNPLKESLIMVVIAGALLSLYVWVLRPYLTHRKEAADQAQLLFPGAKRDRISEFTVQRPEGTYQVRKQAEGNKWSVSQNEKSFEADPSVVDGFFSTLLGAKVEKKLENHPGLDVLGLATPKLKLSLKGEALKENRELLLGNDTPVDYFVYAKWADANEVLLVSRSLRFAIEKSVNDWRSRKIFNTNPEDLSKFDLKISRLDKHPSTLLSLEQSEGNWKVQGKNTKLDNTEIKSFFDRLSNIQVAHFASQDAKDKGKYGFNNPIASMVLTFKDAAKIPQRWVFSSAYDPKTKETKYYFFRQDLDESFEVAESVRDHFRVDLMKFRNKKVPIPAPASVYGIKVHSDKGSVKLQKKDNQWLVKGGDETEESFVPAKGEEVEKLLQSLTSLQVQEYYDGLTPFNLGLQNPARIVEISTRAEGNEVVSSTLFFGKKTGAPQVTTLRAEGMDAAGRVDFKIDESLRIEPSYWAQNPSPAATTGTTPTSNSAEKSSEKSVEKTPNQGEKKKMKLEPTVKSVSELKKLPSAIVKKDHKYTAEITLNNGKKIVITFNANKAPYTVSNFLHLARNGFYNNVKFHRVIAKFVVQGGDPTGTGRGGPGWMFDNEDNDLKHVKGSISMAHAGRNTNGSQFFLVLEPQPHLDGVHTVFGSVTQGIDVMEAIKQGDAMKTVEVFEEAP